MQWFMALAGNDAVLCSATSKSESLISSNTDLFVKGSITFNGCVRWRQILELSHSIPSHLGLPSCCYGISFLFFFFFFFFFNQVKTCFWLDILIDLNFFMQDQITFSCDTTTIILHRMKVKWQSENQSIFIINQRFFVLVKVLLLIGLL